MYSEQFAPTPWKLTTSAGTLAQRVAYWGLRLRCFSTRSRGRDQGVSTSPPVGEGEEQRLCDCGMQNLSWHGFVMAEEEEEEGIGFETPTLSQIDVGCLLVCMHMK
jgi:hypothetical protein